MICVGGWGLDHSPRPRVSVGAQDSALCITQKFVCLCSALEKQLFDVQFLFPILTSTIST